MSLSVPNELAGESEPSAGPDVVNQVFTAATGWGHAARCGCGWKTAHDTGIAALVAGQRHMRSEHAGERDPRPAVGRRPRRKRD